MKLIVVLSGALVAGHAAGQIVLTEFSLGGSASVGNWVTDPGGQVIDTFIINGPGGLNTTREISYLGTPGIVTRFEQTYSTISTGDTLTFTGSLTANEYFSLFPNIEPPELVNHQAHQIGGSIRFTVPDNALVRITGTLYHQPEIFGDPILQNGTIFSGLPEQFIADPFNPPSSTVATIDTTTVMSGTRTISFQSDHGGGANSELGLANTHWEIRIEIIPAPATFLLAPAGLMLATRRRR